MVNSLEQAISIERLALDSPYEQSIIQSTVDYEVVLGRQSDAKIFKLLKTLSSLNDRKSLRSSELKSILPHWFLDVTPSISPEEAEQLLKDRGPEEWRSLPWDLESWMDAFHDRGWYFMGMSRNTDTVSIHLLLISFPASLEAFEHLISAAGAVIVGRNI